MWIEDQDGDLVNLDRIDRIFVQYANGASEVTFRLIATSATGDCLIYRSEDENVIKEELAKLRKLLTAKRPRMMRKF